MQENKTSTITQPDQDNDIITNIKNLNIDKSHHNESHGRSNDVMARFNITPEFDQSVTEPSHLTLNNTHTAMTTPTAMYAQKPIYIRGHLVYHPSPWPAKRMSKVLKGTHEALRAPDYAEEFRDEPGGANSRKKRKHSSSRDRTHNYNMMYDKEKVCVMHPEKATHTTLPMGLCQNFILSGRNDFLMGRRLRKNCRHISSILLPHLYGLIGV